ncbi:MAG: MAPEG family protein [Gammaproteobacteria bacterium]|nr:MAPEG family protein [Gammaproteobacteria bacterium]
MDNILLIRPVIALLLLTIVVAFSMMWTRVLAMKKYKIAPERAEEASNLKTLLPRNVMRISDNYNHLHEQPIVFYVLCILITILNKQDDIYAYLAWIYVLLRGMHTITQICIGDVMKRFTLFLLSWLVLGAIAIRFMIPVFSTLI